MSTQTTQLRRWQILTGDAMATLQSLASASVHCCITSPPYWGLRDYGTAGQLGAEATPEQYVNRLVAIMREVRRVLRDDGTLWLNLGDSYAANRSYQVESTKGGPKHGGAQAKIGGSVVPVGLKAKDLVGIPWRTALALQADGWYLRADIIWHKPNPMPESVTDRPTRAHEYIFLLSKTAHYFYDADAIREPFKHPAMAVKALARRLEGELLPSRYSTLSGRNDGGARYKKGHGYPSNHQAGRNRRSVWTIPGGHYKGAHFATFPIALVEPSIKAGTSERGVCGECGTPLIRATEINRGGPSTRAGRADAGGSNCEGVSFMGGANPTGAAGGSDTRGMASTERRTVGWLTACDHGATVAPAVVLDPFSGAATTGVAAMRLGRKYIGIEINPAYAEMGARRIEQDAPLFNGTAP